MLTVNGEPITDEMIRREMDRLREGYERFMTDAGAAPSEEQLRQWCEENLIERAVLRQEAARRAEPVEAAEVEARAARFKAASDQGEAAPDRADIELEIRVERLVEAVQAQVPEPAAADVAAAYEARKGQWVRPERLHARHLVRHPDRHDRTEAYVELLNVRERLRQGGDFVAEAAEHSDCPDHGGDLGWFARGDMVPRFEDVVFSLPDGAISEVFETEFGLHIAQVLAREPARPVTLAEVRDDLQHQLRTERRTAALEQFVDGLVAAAVIGRDPAAAG